MEKFVQIKFKPLNPFPKQQCITPYKVELHADGSLDQKTPVLSTTWVSGLFCELETCRTLAVFTKLQKATISFSANKKSKLLEKNWVEHISSSTISSTVGY